MAGSPMTIWLGNWGWPMGKIQYSPEAANDLREILRYISQELHSPSAAKNTVNKIRKCIQSVNPFSENSARLDAFLSVKTDYRRVVCGNYLAFYRVEGDVIHVIRVIYGGRDYIRILFGDVALEDEPLDE